MDFVRQAAAFFDIPGFAWKQLIITFSIGHYAFESFLALRQYQVLRRTAPPKALDGAVTKEVYDKSQAYGRAKAKFNFTSEAYALAQNLAFIQYDALPRLWALTGSWLARFAPAMFSGQISHSVLFFFAFNMLSTVLGLPTSIYHTFVLEEKFGFNKQTPSLFVSDIIKTQALIIALGGPVMAAVLKIITATGTAAFYYVWLFAIFMQMFMVTIYPIAILPLFNKLSPLEEGELKSGVESLAGKLQFPLKHLYVIDGSKRSAHSNAYFYGLPWAKHIVIYDTLIAKSETQEVVAVLSHELGHWSLSHTTKLFVISQAHIFYIFALFSVFINNTSLYEAFGFFKEHPVIIGFILFSDILSPMESIVKLLQNVLSRKFEFEADAFAVKLGYSAELARSLVKLQIQNLSTMDADWMYASYHFSHPILPERLGALGWSGDKKFYMDLKKEQESEKAVKAGDREL